VAVRLKELGKVKNAMNETTTTKASRQTHTQGNNKNNEGKQYRKNTNGNVQSVTT
jgi:hypothetical protein